MILWRYTIGDQCWEVVGWPRKTYCCIIVCGHFRGIEGSDNVLNIVTTLCLVQMCWLLSLRSDTGSSVNRVYIGCSLGIPSH